MTLFLNPTKYPHNTQIPGAERAKIKHNPSIKHKLPIVPLLHFLPYPIYFVKIISTKHQPKQTKNIVSIAYLLVKRITNRWSPQKSYQI